VSALEEKNWDGAALGPRRNPKNLRGARPRRLGGGIAKLIRKEEKGQERTPDGTVLAEKDEK